MWLKFNYETWMDSGDILAWQLYLQITQDLLTICLWASQGFDLSPWSQYFSQALVGRFKFFSPIYGGKCCLFFRHFSLKKVVKTQNIFTIL
jgi:hypothetical protein